MSSPQRNSLDSFMAFLLQETSMSSLEMPPIVQDNPCSLMDSSSQSMSSLGRKGSHGRRRSSASNSRLSKVISRWESYPYPAGGGSNSTLSTAASSSYSSFSTSSNNGEASTSSFHFSELPPVPRRLSSDDEESLAMDVEQLQSELSQLVDHCEHEYGPPPPPHIFKDRNASPKLPRRRRDKEEEEGEGQTTTRNDDTRDTPLERAPRYPKRRDSDEHDSRSNDEPEQVLEKPQDRDRYVKATCSDPTGLKDMIMKTMKILGQDDPAGDSTTNVVSVKDALTMMNAKMPKRQTSPHPKTKMKLILSHAKQALALHDDPRFLLGMDSDDDECENEFERGSSGSSGDDDDEQKQDTLHDSNAGTVLSLPLYLRESFQELGLDHGEDVPAILMKRTNSF